MKRKLKAPTPMRIFWTHGTYEETMRHAETLPAIKRQREADRIIETWRANGKRAIGDGQRTFKRLLTIAARFDYHFTEAEARNILPLLLEINERIEAFNRGYAELIAQESDHAATK